MKKTELLILAAPAAVLSCTTDCSTTGSISNEQHQSPNIILLLSDDQGWGQTSYYGHPQLKTPSLDSMAREGVRLDRFYSGAPVSSPSRASILTGRSCDRTAVLDHGYAFRLQEKTLAQALKGKGYTTAHFGKWHLNGFRGVGVPILAEDPRNPGNFGFDKWISVTNFFDMDPLMSENGIIRRYEGESSEIIINQAIEFIEKEKANGKPLFICIWFGSPHNPWETTSEILKEFPSLDAAEAKQYGEITCMDRSIGRLRHYLRKQDMHENTIVWFNSDNGGMKNFGEKTVGGLRGYKGSLYEGGIRVPCVIEWPGTFKHQVCATPTVEMDIFPTIADIVGLDDNTMIKPCDGISLKDLLMGKKMKQREQPIPFRYKGQGAWIDNDYKLIVNDVTKKDCELYHLKKDPKESVNLFQPGEKISEEMFQAYVEWEKSVESSLEGNDYPEGLLYPDPGRHDWMSSPLYKEFIEQYLRSGKTKSRRQPRTSDGSSGR